MGVYCFMDSVSECWHRVNVGLLLIFCYSCCLEDGENRNFQNACNMASKYILQPRSIRVPH
jgi:hypothetical protein